MKNTNNISPKFSFFKAPITNTIPYESIGLAEAYKVISGTYVQKQTLQLRSIIDKKENSNYKINNFPYVTFSGTFSSRNEKALIKHSGLIAIDFDHLEDVHIIKNILLADPFFETELLFISPNGNGLKWIIEISISEKYSHRKMFQAIYNYIKRTYSIEIDKACKDVSRATFLCYDPDAYINPKYLIK